MEDFKTNVCIVIFIILILIAIAAWPITLSWVAYNWGVLDIPLSQACWEGVKAWFLCQLCWIPAIGIYILIEKEL